MIILNVNFSVVEGRWNLFAQMTVASQISRDQEITDINSNYNAVNCQSIRSKGPKFCIQKETNIRKLTMISTLEGRLEILEPFQ